MVEQPFNLRFTRPGQVDRTTDDICSDFTKTLTIYSTTEVQMTIMKTQVVNMVPREHRKILLH